MAPRDYGYLVGLSALWGSSYLFIKIALEGHVAPAEIVLGRLLMATAVLYLVARAQGRRLPRLGHTWRSFAVMGLVGTAAPFSLISWGETRIASSLAAILNATVPIATVLLAHFWTRDERLTIGRVAGVLIGFAGVVVLAGNAAVGAHSGALLGVLALLLSSVCYGIANIFARGAFRGVPPVVASTGQMLLGTVFMAVPGATATLSARQAPAPGALAAVAALALLGTVGAYLLYYRLLLRVGPTRTSLTTYLLSAFAVVYGALFLHEAITVRLLIGFALIVLGVVVVNGHIRPHWAARGRAAAAR
jgi:drug/metabolite transporter (DMT)-like permease